jgi:hypothetical protein
LNEAGQLNIGPLQWILQLPDGGSVRYDAPAYGGFWSGSAVRPLPPPLVSLPVSIRCAARSVPAERPLYRSGEHWALWEEDGERIVCSGFHPQQAARFFCRFDSGLTAASVDLDPSREGNGGRFFEAPLRYPLDQILSWGMLARCGGLILHAAVAVKDGKAFVFAGRSGAGKSTLSALCFRSGWRILNDDRAMVFRRGGAFRVAGTPWHGSGRFAEADELPLSGLCFIEKSADDRIETVASRASRMALLDTAAIPWFEESWAQGALDAADRLLGGIPLYRLHFRKELSAVQTLETACGQTEGAAA